MCGRGSIPDQKKKKNVIYFSTNSVQNFTSKGYS